MARSRCRVLYTSRGKSLDPLLKRSGMLDHKCPYCEKALEIEPRQDGAIPTVGALLLCQLCGELIMMGDGLIVRKLTMKELIDLQCGINWPALEIMSIGVKVANGLWI
jgi:hypothetical protein